MTEPVQPSDGLRTYYETGLDFGRKTQAEHSKWLINTLYLLHSGAIAGILYKVPIERISNFVGSLTCFATGLALAYLTALATWINYKFYISAHIESLKTIRENRWSAETTPTKNIVLTNRTEKLALLVGIASFMCLLIGAHLAFWNLYSLTNAK